ncbi:unnamed protein product, partial [marine sediment metagenome]
MILSITLEGGGSEKRTVYLLKYINRNIFEPILCLKEKKGEYLKDIPRHTKLYAIKRRYKLLTLLEMCKVILKEKPDIIFGNNVWGMNTIAIVALKLMFLKRQVKLIMGVGTNPSYF